MKLNKLIFFLCPLLLMSIEVRAFQRMISLSESFPNDSIAKNREMPACDDQIIFAQEIIIDTLVFSSADTVEIQLDQEEIIVSKKHSVVDKGIGYRYSAYESDMAQVFISKLQNNLHGIIHSASGTYRIETYDKKFVLEKISMDDVPNEEAPIIPEDFIEAIDPFAEDIRSNNATIRVLVLYTPEALVLRPNILNKVFTDINNGNTSFVNSNVNARFELAYVGPTGDSEYGLSFEQLLDKFRTIGDGKFDEVHTLRNKYVADVCILLVSSNSVCGKGYINADFNYAFAVVNASTGCEGKYTFTHEIGHNIGCGHDLAASEHYSPYDYGHGYVHYISGNSSSSWRTMMAYGDACGGEYYCWRIPYWSNPDIYYYGYATGTSTNANNTRVWNERASTVAAFKNMPANITYTSANNNTTAIYESIEAATQIITSAGYEIQSGQTVDMAASTTIRLLPNTRIKNGATFRAAIRANADTHTYPQFIKERHESNDMQTNSDKHQVQKILREGQIYVLRDGRIYTLQGLELNTFIW